MKHKDISRETVINVAKYGTNDEREQIIKIAQEVKVVTPIVINDSETLNLIDNIAREQNITQSVAIKKCIVLAAYLYQLEGCKFYVEREDKSVGEIKLP